jgi:hypothetical protein
VTLLALNVSSVTLLTFALRARAGHHLTAASVRLSIVS